jgi:hypothetical protein
MMERFHSQIAGEGLVEEGFLQLVEGVELVLVEGFEPLGFGGERFKGFSQPLLLSY